MAARLRKVGSGDRIWTYDLRVMSPTSYQTAPPRNNLGRPLRIEETNYITLFDLVQTKQVAASPIWAEIRILNWSDAIKFKVEDIPFNF